MASIREITSPACNLINMSTADFIKDLTSNHKASFITGNSDNECIKTSAISSRMDDIIGLGKLFAPLSGNWHRIIGLIQWNSVI